MTQVRTTPARCRFGSLEIGYDDRVLEPRPWTVKQGVWAAELARRQPGGRILELCAGAGHIGLLAARLSGRRLVAVDADPVACSWALANAQHNRLGPRVEIRQGDLVSACREDEQFPVIIADPPWVRRADVDAFPRDPVHAIDGGEDGLVLVRACLAVVSKHLAPRGDAVLQIGPEPQASALVDRIPAGLEIVEMRDEPGRGTLVHLTRPGSRP